MVMQLVPCGGSGELGGEERLGGVALLPQVQLVFATFSPPAGTVRASASAWMTPCMVSLGQGVVVPLDAPHPFPHVAAVPRLLGLRLA
jgi:hypothetical protein